MDLLNIQALALAAAVFVPLERLLPRRRQSILRKGWKADLAHAVITQLLVRSGLIALIALAIFASAGTLSSPALAAIRYQPLAVQVVEMMILGDLCYYLAHRMSHRIPALWRYHSVHHSVEYMDWLATYRSHPVDLVITKGAQYLPLFYLGFSPAALLWYSAIFSWHSFLLHSNFRFDVGPIRWIIALPQYHHWHHANEPAALDKNFAAQLSLLDVIFGSWHCPAHAPTRYGSQEAVAGTYIGQLLHPFDRSPSCPSRLANH